MDLDVAITGRRAVREYTAQAVDEKLIRALIGAAVQAPSAVNQQPWTFTVVRDQGVLDRISREAKLHMLATMPRKFAIRSSPAPSCGSRIFTSFITRLC
jgi:nitroreductase